MSHAKIPPTFNWVLHDGEVWHDGRWDVRISEYYEVMMESIMLQIQ